MSQSNPTIPPPTFLRSSFQVIFPFIQKQLCAVTGLLPDNVFVTVLEPDETPHYGADKEILVQPLDESGAGGSSFEGSGRVDNRRTRVMRFIIRTRLYGDKYPADTVKLYSTAALSHTILEDKAYDALCWYDILDNSGNALTMPGEPGRMERPRREKSVSHTSNSDACWVWSSFTISYEYIRNLNQNQRD